LLGLLMGKLQRTSLLIAQPQPALHFEGLKSHVAEGIQIAETQQTLAFTGAHFLLAAGANLQFAKIGVADR
jgi:hypothetical protein